MADHGFRRTDQMNADKLLITAAIAISIAGSRTSMGLGSISNPWSLAYFLFAIGKNLSIEYD
jgi:hypothetical protein